MTPLMLVTEHFALQRRFRGVDDDDDDDDDDDVQLPHEHQAENQRITKSLKEFVESNLENTRTEFQDKDMKINENHHLLKYTNYHIIRIRFIVTPIIHTQQFSIDHSVHIYKQTHI